MRKFPFLSNTGFWILLAFAIWAYAFRGFLTSQLALVEDAVSYYDHIKFYVESLSQGVYPMWDPNWHQGSSNDFFLRRIGAYNPFYLVIAVLKGLGLSYTIAYLWFLAGYYFLGMTGFYLLVMRIYNHQLLALTGYLLLLFSALGTRLFDSYMMLVTVPLIWFFYFLVAFSQTPRRIFLLGMMLAFGILATTYIPFYFLMFLGVFVLSFALIYPDKLSGIIGRYHTFYRANKMLVIASLLFMALCFVPMLLFYHQSGQGGIALPGRHGEDTQSHVLTVPSQTLKWGVLEDLLYSSYFSNLHRYKFAIVYVPFFVFIPWCLGLLGRLSRRLALIFLCGFTVLLAIIPFGLPFYNFLNEHVFIMKYFRNLHFFLWFVLIPLFVLLGIEHFKLFLDFKRDSLKSRVALMVYNLLAHVLAALFIWWRQDVAVSTCVMLMMSLVFFSGLISGRLTHKPFIYVWLTVMIAIQPLETYGYLSQRAIPYRGLYQYDHVMDQFKFRADGKPGAPTDYSNAKPGLYYASGVYNNLYNAVGNYALAVYLRYRLVLVDEVKVLEAGYETEKIERLFINKDNFAYVSDSGKPMKLLADRHLGGGEPVFIEGNSPVLFVERYNSNQLRLRTKLPTEKFLVYNDSYDPQWQAYVNGRPVGLVQANGAFKGIWVPAGDAVVEFRYGAWWQYWLNIILLLSFYGLLAVILFLLFKRRRNPDEIMVTQ